MFHRDDILRFLIEKLDLRIFPLHSVDDTGKCTCLNKEKCKNAGKHPFRNFGWKKKATRNLDTINKITKDKNFNIAVATGDLSKATNKYLVVVDVDVPTHEIQGSLPKTFSYKTGGGGYHYWYWSPVPIRNSASKIAEKVDVRGTNGYVIVPPSKHRSGNSYEFIGQGINEPISDLPQFVLDKIKTSAEDIKIKRRVTKKRKVSTEVNKINFDWWNENPIPVLQKALEGGTLIPLGVRNNTIFRLLSSHRAKGVATYEDLMALGTKYKTFLETPETFDDKELRGIVISVMRFPIYNSSAENVNKNYCKWLEKRGIKSDIEMIEKVDDLFFSSLKPGKGRVSLEWVVKQRDTWYAKHGIKEYAVYKSQLLAAKLRGLGFSRTRTSKANLWNIETNENVLAQAVETCEDVSNRRDKMAKKNTRKTAEEKVLGDMSDTLNEVIASQSEIVPASDAVTSEAQNTPEEIEAAEPNMDGSQTPGEEEASANGPIGPDGNPLTLVEEREDIITTDRKYNPDDFKFNGMQQSSQDLLMAQIKLFEKLSPEQEIAYEQGTLIYDEERTRDFMDAIQKGDIVGVKNTMYRIHSVEDDHLVASPRGYNKYDRKYHFETPEETISIVDLDNALTMGFGQILYRNDKPFGLDDEMTYKVRVRVYADSVGRTYVFKSGREVIKHQQPEEKNVTATTTTKDSA